ncbi:MAG: gamma-glutamyl-gamma-aminobutyrate hydrolase family protein [Candidatus Marinimicrobia bacterium]|nr:gamma-glutamyl-gamma-aminobutyrate hydrolase family protein [Candidatus Neomarinimicrobiota bacterium]
MAAHARPVIGIAISPPEDGSPYYNLNPEYSDAIWRAGGSPIAFPLIADKEYVQQVFTQVHGLLLTGSNYDLDPASYGQVSHDRSSAPNRDRDNLDHLLLQRAVSPACRCWASVTAARQSMWHWGVP